MKAFAGVVGLLAASCATVVPLQTASVVAPGKTRVGGQLAFAAFCGTPGGVLSLLGCNQFPDGVPLPEVRANVRHGVGWSSDVGGSLVAQGQVQAPEHVLKVGLTADFKRELLHVSGAPGFQHVVALGVVGGGAVAGRWGLAPTGTFEWGVPLFYGLQTQRLEWVASVALDQRLVIGGAGVPAPPALTTLVGVTVGLFQREPAGLGVQLGYLTDVRLPLRGALQVQVGGFWDL